MKVDSSAHLSLNLFGIFTVNFLLAAFVLGLMSASRESTDSSQSIKFSKAPASPGFLASF